MAPGPDVAPSWSRARGRSPGRARCSRAGSGGRSAAARTPPWYAEDGPAVRVAALRRLLPAGSRAQPPHRALGARRSTCSAPARRHGGPRAGSSTRGPGLQTHSARLADDELCLVDGLLVVSAARAVRRRGAVRAARRGGRRGGRRAARRLGDRGRARRGAGPVRRPARGARGPQALRSPSRGASRRRRAACGCSSSSAGCRGPSRSTTSTGRTGTSRAATSGSRASCSSSTAARCTSSRGVFEQERRRQSGMLELGLEVRRFTGGDVFRRSRADLCAEVCGAWRRRRGATRPELRTGPDTLPAPRHRPLPTLDQRRAA